jgi:hypothetical protein
MTQEEFISILKEEEYSYEVEGDRIVVTGGGCMLLLGLRIGVVI